VVVTTTPRAELTICQLCGMLALEGGDCDQPAFAALVAPTTRRARNAAPNPPPGTKLSGAAERPARTRRRDGNPAKEDPLARTRRQLSEPRNHARLTRQIAP
jgi:hypothetical protein